MTLRTITALFIACCTVASAAAIEGSFDRTLNISGPVDLDAITDAGGIVITAGSSGTVRIHAILKSTSDKWIDTRTVEQHIRQLEQNPPIEQNGNTIRVGHIREKSFLRGISMQLEITTPAETKARARADSGGIHIAGVNGPVDCATDSGAIQINDIGSEVRASADSGGIHIRNVRGPIVAHADSGAVELLEIAGSVDAKTDSGGIRIAQTKPAAILARADSGGARITLAPTGGYDIRASSDSGRMTFPEMVVHGNFSKHHTEGKVRGGGPLVDVKVDSGNIHIE